MPYAKTMPQTAEKRAEFYMLVNAWKETGNTHFLKRLHKMIRKAPKH